MDIKQDTLYKNLDKKEKMFRNEAKKHRRLKRFLWTLSSILTVGLAICANFDFQIGSITSSGLTKIISIVVPVVTGYAILRSPESLWIMEIDMRNKLADLKQRLMLIAERDPDFNRADLEKEYFKIMEEANNRWLEIKQGSGKAIGR